jgi:hypothetical protein
MKFCKTFHSLINGKTNAVIGKIKNIVNIIASDKIRRRNKNKSAKINRLFITIPIMMEKPTNPSRYSFFQGRKKVLSISGSEKTPKKAEFREAKNRRIFLGASKYQNFRKMKGNNKIPCIGSTFSLSY